MPPSVLQSSPVEGKKNGDNVGERSKKPAWKLPGGSVPTGPVMGDSSWPALSDCTRVASKSTSSPSLIATGKESISNLDAPTQPVTISLHPTSAPKHATDGSNADNSSGLLADGADNSSGLLADGKPELPAVQPVSMKMPPPAAVDKPELPAVQPVSMKVPPAAAVDKQKRPVPTPQGPHKVNSTWVSTARPPQGGDYHQNYGGNHRGIGGRPHPNGNGNHRPHPNGYGNHRYQDHGSQEWRPSGSSNAHGLSAPHYWARPQPFFTPPPLPPPPAPPFFSPPHFQPSMNHVGYPEASFYDYYVPPNPPHPPPGLYRGMPSIPRPVPPATPPAVVNPALDVRAKLIKQIDYYFSENNLCHDIYLRRNMDDQGWVPLALIAGFMKVKELTGDLQFISNALRFSSTVEVQGGKIRRRDNWTKWLMQPHHREFYAMNPQSSHMGKGYTMVAPMQNVGLRGSSSVNGMMGTATSHEQESDSSEIMSPLEIVNCDTSVAALQNVGLEGSISIESTRDTATNGELNEQMSMDFMRLKVGDTYEESDVQNQS